MSDLLAQAEASLRAHGGRMTGQRRQILETLDLLGGHPTAEQLYAAVHRQDAAIHPATVYRTLGWLANEGLVSPRHLDPGRDRCEHFELSPPAEHHHFICTRCSKVIEFAAGAIEEVRQQFAQQHGADVAIASLTLYGLCAQCRSRLSGARRGIPDSVPPVPKLGSDLRDPGEVL